MLCYNSNGGILTMIDKYKNNNGKHSQNPPLTKYKGETHINKTNCLVDKSHPHSMYYNPSDGTFTCLISRIHVQI